MKSKVDRPTGFGIVLIVLAGSLWAQAPAANQTGEGLASAAAGASLTDPSSSLPSASSAMKPHDDSFIIGNDDVLGINVWKQPDITRAIPVRSDGKISLPLVGEVQAAGRTPLQLEQEIAGRLRTYIADPEVTVIVQEINSEKFNILGYIAKPGSYSLTLAPTVLDAIAQAGGFKDFAKEKSIYILRTNPNGSESRLPFNYKAVIKGKHPEQNIKLQPHDTIVVP